jgi:hypothetical protein
MEDFLRIYTEVRPQALKDANIQSAFQATEHIPFALEVVLAKLNVKLAVTPPLDLPSSSVNSIQNTPRTVPQLERSMKAMRKRQHEL